MLKMRSVRLVPLLVALLVWSAVAQSQGPPPSAGQTVSRPPEEKPASDKQRPNPEQRGTQETPFFVQILPTPQANEKPANDTTQQPNKATPHWTASDSIAGIAAIAGILQAIALVITIVVLVRTARRQLRAYILPEAGALCDGTMLNPPQPVHANDPGVILSFKNSGPTPAFKFVSWAQIAITGPADAHTLVAPPFASVYPATIGAGGNVTKALWFGRPLTQAEISEVLHATKLIFVYGRLEYRDAFRRERWATFRLHYGGLFPPPPNVTFSFSDGGNDSN